jgi:hypothetical protein
MAKKSRQLIRKAFSESRLNVAHGTALTHTRRREKPQDVADSVVMKESGFPSSTRSVTLVVISVRSLSCSHEIVRRRFPKRTLRSGLRVVTYRKNRVITGPDEPKTWEAAPCCFSDHPACRSGSMPMHHVQQFSPSSSPLFSCGGFLFWRPDLLFGT